MNINILVAKINNKLGIFCLNHYKNYVFHYYYFHTTLKTVGISKFFFKSFLTLPLYFLQQYLNKIFFFCEF